MFHSDLTISFNEEVRVINKHRKFIESSAKRYHFTQGEIVNIILIYYKLLKKNKECGIEGVMKKNLLNILHFGLDITDNELIPNIITVLDRKVQPTLSLRSWVHMFALYLKGTLEEKIRYTYNVIHVFF